MAPFDNLMSFDDCAGCAESPLESDVDSEVSGSGASFNHIPPGAGAHWRERSRSGRTILKRKSKWLSGVCFVAARMDTSFVPQLVGVI